MYGGCYPVEVVGEMESDMLAAWDPLIPPVSDNSFFNVSYMLVDTLCFMLCGTTSQRREITREEGTLDMPAICEHLPRNLVGVTAAMDGYVDEKSVVRLFCLLLQLPDASGASTVAIDNKIEQAMDLVKSHLMFAVREEVEVLKEQIKELLEKNSQLEYENSILRSSASPETLSQLSAAAPAVAPSSQGPTKASQPPPPTTS